MSTLTLDTSNATFSPDGFVWGTNSGHTVYQGYTQISTRAHGTELKFWYWDFGSINVYVSVDGGAYSQVTRKAEVAGIQWVAHNVVRMDRLPQEAFYRTRTATGVSAAVRAPAWTPPASDVVEPSKPTAADEQVARFQAALALASTELAMSRWMADVQQAVFGRVK